ncbi:MAG: class I SAM-dependent methyltransferase [Cyanobacteria bacterium P01_F01_bin.3]
MAEFYQSGYKQPGLTTELPCDSELASLVQAKFRGSSKDFSRVVRLLRILGIGEGSRVLDFGANWGYGVWQLKDAGYDAIGYEISKPRAEYSKKLGVRVLTAWEEVTESGLFDVVFSSHVLEHTPDPASSIFDQIGTIKDGGFLVAIFPNGSTSFQLANYNNFHRLWGRVHPVMLNDTYLARLLDEYPLFQAGTDGESFDSLSNWGGDSNYTGDLSSNEMLVVARIVRTRSTEVI